MASGNSVRSTLAAMASKYLYVCNNCRNYISGVRYKCTICPNYHLCSKCISTHDSTGHAMTRITTPGNYSSSHENLSAGATDPSSIENRRHSMDNPGESANSKEERLKKILSTGKDIASGAMDLLKGGVDLATSIAGLVGGSLDLATNAVNLASALK